MAGDLHFALPARRQQHATVSCLAGKAAKRGHLLFALPARRHTGGAFTLPCRQASAGEILALRERAETLAEFDIANIDNLETHALATTYIEYATAADFTGRH
jgi:hypothetical protein